VIVGRAIRKVKICENKFLLCVQRGRAPSGRFGSGIFLRDCVPAAQWRTFIMPFGVLFLASFARGRLAYEKRATSELAGGASPQLRAEQSTASARRPIDGPVFRGLEGHKEA
jgi:hypothetical protein